MQLPSLVLLSSVALALIAQAAPIDSNVNVPSDNPEIISPHARTSPIEHPVGNGIVYSSTSFLASTPLEDIPVNPEANNAQDASASVPPAASDPFGSIAAMLSGGMKDGLQTLGTSDLESLISIEIGSPSKKEDDDEWDETWRCSTLFGDTGYVKRALPLQPDGKSCPSLPFLDQMVWDQQGDRGKAIVDPPPKTNGDALVTTAAEELTEAPEAKADLTKALPVQEVMPEAVVPEVSKPEVVAPVIQVNDKNDIKTDDKKEVKADDKKEAKTDDKKEAKTDDKKEVKTGDKKAKGGDGKSVVRICILGICIGTPEDKDDKDDRDKDRNHCRRVHHKQRRFLEQFKGQALKINPSTGCPIPTSEH
ncbi:hypothetical protein BGW38_004132 [Lunasporangiospora selenospora]|uniref:Uncharacterized protein n=1 Tax=Lunasporangiospora selenospora TaxID=979761 RepID=A0A9P6FRQ5_9FUNG|nr:hypothetical protein BGW38_004132 [Lunasporangiospora selenospora]